MNNSLEYPAASESGGKQANLVQLTCSAIKGQLTQQTGGENCTLTSGVAARWS